MGKSLIIQAFVTDVANGETINTNHTRVVFTRTPYRFNWDNTRRYFKKGLPFPVKVMRQNKDNNELYRPFRNDGFGCGFGFRLAWPRGCFKKLRVLCVYTLRSSDDRTESEAESKAVVVVSKRAKGLR